MLAVNEDKFAELSEFIKQLPQDGRIESHLIAVLHKTQALFGYLPEDAMNSVSEQMEIPTAHIWGVATFYHYFNLSMPGKYVISVCLGTACYVKGAAQIMQTLEQNLGIKMGQTTNDGLFSIQQARCLGACGLAPVVMINDKIHGKLNSKKLLAIIKDIQKAEAKK
ncbi:MAG: NAD(P)H-dependent oxidoreductase subunit E [Phycisphaerae bacterium]|jgi:NADH:ubiquinone oxidoreductase subunit E